MLMWFFNYENDIAITDQAQDGCGMAKNSVPTSCVTNLTAIILGAPEVNGKSIRRSLETA
jgi:hypothetical protein